VEADRHAHLRRGEGVLEQPLEPLGRQLDQQVVELAVAQLANIGG
jgi:hypothetical protein